jgi:type I restriction enzyme R subunit
MSSLTPTEGKFEQYIEAQLQQKGYESIDHNEYDRNLCLIKSQLIAFIRNTQSESWGRLTEIYGVDTENKVLARINQEITNRGIIDVLRNQVVDRGVYLDLCYFEPKSDLNPDHRNLFKQNQFSLVRQLRYSQQNENSIDMVLFLNGLPIVTMELKNQLTGQNFKHSENQYKNDRNPAHEPLLKFKRCLVHFCVDNNKVSMTTKLNGSNTLFLPYNQDIENPEVANGYRTQYLWQQILTPNTLLDIIENFVHLSEEKQSYFNEQSQKLETKTKKAFSATHDRFWKVLFYRMASSYLNFVVSICRRHQAYVR